MSGFGCQACCRESSWENDECAWRIGTIFDKLESSLFLAPRIAAAGRRAMKYFLRPLVFSTLCAALCVVFPSRAQNPPPPEAPPRAPSAPQTPAKRVWTNENISSVQGPVSVVDTDRSSRSPASSSKWRNLHQPQSRANRPSRRDHSR